MKKIIKVEAVAFPAHIAMLVQFRQSLKQVNDWKYGNWKYISDDLHMYIDHRVTTGYAVVWMNGKGVSFHPDYSWYVEATVETDDYIKLRNTLEANCNSFKHLEYVEHWLHTFKIDAQFMSATLEESIKQFDRFMHQDGDFEVHALLHLAKYGNITLMLENYEKLAEVLEYDLNLM